MRRATRHSQGENFTLYVTSALARPPPTAGTSASSLVGLCSSAWACGGCVYIASSVCGCVGNGETHTQLGAAVGLVWRQLL